MQGDTPTAPSAACKRAAQPGARMAPCPLQSRAHPLPRWAEPWGSYWEQGIAGKWGDRKGAHTAALLRGHGSGALPAPRCPSLPDTVPRCLDGEHAWASGHPPGRARSRSTTGGCSLTGCAASPKTPAGTRPCRYGFGVGGCTTPNGADLGPVLPELPSGWAVSWTQAWPTSPGSGLKCVSALSPAGSSTSARRYSSGGGNGSALPLPLTPFTAEDFYFLTG